MTESVLPSSNKNSSSFSLSVSRVAILKFGLHLLALYWTFWVPFRPEGLTPFNVILASVLLTGAACIAAALLLPPRLGSRPLITTGRVLYGALLGWWVLVIIRGFPSQPDRFLTWVANPQVGSLGWVAPLAVLVGCREWMFRPLWRTFFIHALCGTAVSLILFAVYSLNPTALPPKSFTWDAATNLFYGVPFLILVRWGGSRERLMLWVALACMILVYILVFYRSFTVLYLCFALYALLIRNTDSLRALLKRTTLFVLVSGTCVLLLAPIVENSLPEEAFYDTRTFLVEELFADMSREETIVGRGALGRYFSPYFEERMLTYESGDFPDRQLSEIGYLHVVLKAGFIGVFLYVVLVVSALVRIALKHSLSRYDFVLAVIMIIELLVMFVHGDTYFSMHNLLFWMIVGSALARTRPAPPS